MILQTNIDDKLYKGLTKHFDATQIDSVVNHALAEYLEDLEDIKDANEILARIRAGEPTIPFEEIRKELGLDD